MLNDDKNNITALFFIDPERMNEKIDQPTNTEEEGFFGNLFTSVRGMFNSKSKTAVEFAQELGEEMTVIEIDSTNPEFKPMKDFFNIIDIPRLVILSDGNVLLNQAPSKKSSQAIEKVRATCLTTVTAEEIAQNVTSVVTIAPGHAQFKPIDKDDPFYFGDNDAVYNEIYYKDTMNGGLISKSDRLPIGLAGKTKETIEKTEQETKPYDKLSLVDDISFYGNPVEEDTYGGHPPPVRVEIERMPVVEKRVVVIEEPVYIKVIDIPDPEDPLVSNEIEFNTVRPVKIPQGPAYVEHQVVIPQVVVGRVELDQIQPVRVSQVEPVQEVVVEEYPVYPPALVRTIVQPPREKVVYREIIEEPEIIEEDTRVITTYRTVPNNVRRREYVTRIPYPPNISPEDFKLIQIDDGNFTEQLRLSEEEIRESEEKFKKAREEIEKSVEDSEEKMKEYEKKLNELYFARDMALKARENLYKPCQK
jgi:hypothetical protein